MYATTAIFTLSIIFSLPGHLDVLRTSFSRFPHFSPLQRFVGTAVLTICRHDISVDTPVDPTFLEIAFECMVWWRRLDQGT